MTTIIVTVALAFAGYLATYFNSLRLAEREAKLTRVNQQLSDFYGPLFALMESNGRTYDTFSETYTRPDGRDPFLHDTPPTEHELAEWRIWATTVFIPNIQAMREVIVAKADLLIEEQMPEVLLQLCAHVSGYEVTLHAGLKATTKSTCRSYTSPAESSESTSADGLRSLNANKQDCSGTTTVTAGWPIAAGITEGSCRHIIADRLSFSRGRDRAWTGRDRPYLPHGHQQRRLRRILAIPLEVRASASLPGIWQGHTSSEPDQLAHSKRAAPKGNGITTERSTATPAAGTTRRTWKSLNLMPHFRLRRGLPTPARRSRCGLGTDRLKRQKAERGGTAAPRAGASNAAHGLRPAPGSAGLRPSGCAPTAVRSCRMPLPACARTTACPPGRWHGRRQLRRRRCH